MALAYARRLPLESARKLRWYDKGELPAIVRTHLREKRELQDALAAMKRVGHMACIGLAPQVQQAAGAAGRAGGLEALVVRGFAGMKHGMALVCVLLQAGLHGTGLGPAGLHVQAGRLHVHACHTCMPGLQNTGTLTPAPVAPSYAPLCRRSCCFGRV